MTERLLNYNEIRSRLEDRRLSYVAEKCGLTYMVLSRIKKGEGKPSLETVEKLTQYFDENK
ncbi:MAG TPA: hypothetical protein DCE52_04205 [Rhodobacteraceae bacterium]|jgi:transcriptional regulator with XRE-family HTH domain|nr:hypothetical protein [Paracoccaceae bacterium]